MVQQIAGKFKLQKIILFGSYARGDYRCESDVDILVVMETPLKEVQQSLEIYRHLNVMFGLDLIVYTPKHLKERFDTQDWFVRDILMVLLKNKINSKIGNKGIKIKAPHYQDSDFELTKALGKEQTWDTTKIEEKQKMLADLAVKAWPNKA